jgi:hypothetical protein
MITVDLPAAVIGFAGVHMALRAEAATIERAAIDGDLLLARRRAALLGRVLACHHHAEDTLLFPALVARQPGVAASTDALEAQHVTLDHALAALRDDVAGRAGEVRNLVESHLRDEEQHVLPVWLGSFTADEHERFAVALRRSTPLADAGLMVSWLLDASPPETLDLARSQVPSPIRAAHRLWFRRRYERRFGSAQPLAA